VNKTVRTVAWSERSLKQAKWIKRYLENKFGEAEVSSFPLLYPKSGFKKSIRRAVMNKNLSYTDIKKYKIRIKK